VGADPDGRLGEFFDGEVRCFAIIESILATSGHLDALATLAEEIADPEERRVFRKGLGDLIGVACTSSS